MNGFSDKEMIQMVLAGQQGLQSQIALLVEKVESVQNKGCAHREDDLRRIGELEGWRTKGIVGTVVALFTGIGALIGVIFGRH
jgi:hypothetical protein